jgi:hypothetical protein
MIDRVLSAKPPPGHVENDIDASLAGPKFRFGVTNIGDA